jgi:hypothetical protein
MEKVYAYPPRWKWFPGIPADLWLSHADMVSKFIKTNKLRPIGREYFELTTREKQVIDITDIINPWGGKKFAHLHFQGEIYPLNDAQWEAFSGTILSGFAEKLANAKTVNFEQLVQLADVMGTISRK